MKKSIAYFFSLLIILLVASVFLISCKPKQVLTNTESHTTVTHDSTKMDKVTDNNKAIIDSLIIKIAKIKTARPECDSITQVAINNLLEQMNISKQSGDNGYILQYNALKHQLELLIKIGATKNQTTNTDKLKSIVKVDTKIVEVPVQTPLAKWKLWLMYLGGASIIFNIYKAYKYFKDKIPTV